MNKKNEKPCLHCIVGKVVEGYMEEHGFDPQYVLDKLAEVVGDILSHASDEDIVRAWEEALARFEDVVLERAMASKLQDTQGRIQ